MIEDLLSDLDDILLPYKTNRETALNEEVIEEDRETLFITETINENKDFTIFIYKNRGDIYDSKGFLLIDDKKYEIAFWCNLKALIKGDYRTTDYLLSSLGLDIHDFDIKDRTNEVQYV